MSTVSKTRRLFIYFCPSFGCFRWESKSGPWISLLTSGSGGPNTIPIWNTYPPEPLAIETLKLGCTLSNLALKSASFQEKTAIILSFYHCRLSQEPGTWLAPREAGVGKETILSEQLSISVWCFLPTFVDGLLQFSSCLSAGNESWAKWTLLGLVIHDYNYPQKCTL